MKFVLISFASLLFTTQAYSAALQCEIKVNETSVLTQIVNTSLNQKIEIGETDSIRAYVTEKADRLFSIEVFLGNYETRVYSEGFLKNSTDTLHLSFWNRDILLDVQCINPSTN